VFQGGALGLSIQDYAWATQQIAQVAEDMCQGRLVSVLEGGYDVSPLSNGLACAVEAHVAQLMR
jgi:acetoin utilization deacetylase AcuC-like enzyme